MQPWKCIEFWALVSLKQLTSKHSRLSLACGEFRTNNRNHSLWSTRGNRLGKHDSTFLVGGLLIVELKAIDCLQPIHQAQVINYLKATSCELGLLINFNVTLLKDGLKRVVLTQ